MVGLWWIGFSQITFRRLPKDQGGPLSREALQKGYEELQKVFQNVKRQGNINRFLMAFFCYSAGVTNGPLFGLYLCYCRTPI